MDAFTAFVQFAENPPLVVQIIAGILFAAGSIGVIVGAAIGTHRKCSF